MKDRESTSSRATRRKHVRTRQASRALARTAWLRDTLVGWTGRREEIPSLQGALTPIRALLQDRLAGLPAGVYAVRIEPPSDAAKPRLHLEVSAVEAVTRDLLARTARAIEAVSKFPKAATRFIGPVDPWCDGARRMLAERRETTENGGAWRIGASAQAASPSSQNDRLVECYEDEHRLGSAPASIPAGDRAALDLLLDAIKAVRREPARRFLQFDPSIGFVPFPPLHDAYLDKIHPGHAGDPAGAFSFMAAAGRLSRMSGADACAASATWLEACRPLLPTAHFWPIALSAVTSPCEPSSRERARAVVASLSTHATPLASALANTHDDDADAVRRALPLVVARGPDATGRALRCGLWLEHGDNLDAVLRFVDAAERVGGAAHPAPAIPLPRRVFELRDPALRDALLDTGLSLWTDGQDEALAVTALLHLIGGAAGRPGAAPWRRVLPHLHAETRALWRRIGTRGRSANGALVGDVASLAFIVLDACVRWAGAGFGDTRRLGRMLADRWPSSDHAAAEWDPDHDDHNNLVVSLSEGRAARFLALMRLPRAPRRHAWHGGDGFRLVSKHETALAWVCAALDRSDLHARVVRMLEHAGLLARLDPGIRPSRLFSALDQPADPPGRWPAWVSQDEAAALAGVLRVHAVSAGAPDLPPALKRILERPSTMAREGEALRERASKRALSPAGRARLERIDALAGNAAARRSDLRRALDRALPKQRALAGLAALETIVRGALDRRWQSALGGVGHGPSGPAWDNALLMLESVTHNKRVLRRLLRESANGNRTWMFGLAPNRAFLDRLEAAGVSPDAWLGAHARTVDVGEAPLTAYVATDPLEILQMGSLFGTCLSADRFNAHAAVAAAVEANKRVLYVRDRAGRVLGRQLLAITAIGELIGFTCYGAGLDDLRRTGQRVRTALALLALDIVRACGARLMPSARVAEGLTGEQAVALSLFCKGYVDSTFAFDWWIEGLAAAGPSSEAEDRARVAGWLLESVPAHRNARLGPDWKGDELGWETARAMLWLGPAAPELPEAQARALGFGERHRLVTRSGECRAPD